MPHPLVPLSAQQLVPTDKLASRRGGGKRGVPFPGQKKPRPAAFSALGYWHAALLGLEKEDGLLPALFCFGTRTGR